jgi:hypothetical protein
MKRYWILKVLRLLVFLGVAVSALGYAVMTLWNWVLPPVTGLHVISYAQALALLVLARVLFGSFRGRRYGGGLWRQRIRARWQQMSPEERERFGEALKARGDCCRPGGDFSSEGPQRVT